MILQIITLLILSILVVVFPHLFSYALHWLYRLYHIIIYWFSLILSSSTLGQFIQSTLALLVIPLFSGIIFLFFLTLMHKKRITWVMQVIWIVWMLLVATVVLR
jgi:hypothetical protein